MVLGLSHITLVVRNLKRTAAFLEKVLDAREVYDSGDKTFSLAREKFFLISGCWVCLMEGEPLPERTYNHIAFQVRERDLDDYAGRLKEIGAQIKEGRPRVEGEGRSIYFYDFDNHLFELHTGTLAERLLRYTQDR